MSTSKSAVKLTYIPSHIPALPKAIGTGAPKGVDDVAEAIKAKFGAGAVKGVEKAHKGDGFVVVDPAKLFDVLRLLRDDERFLCQSLQVVGTVDYPPAPAPVAGTEPPAASLIPGDPKDCISVVYVVYSYVHRHQLTVKVLLDRSNPRVASVCEIFRSANWYERECYDMTGVIFEGHPNHARILLPTDWVGFPLRRDYVFPEEYNGMKVPL